MQKEEITMLIEATQDITVIAWGKVYNRIGGYEDSRIVLDLFRSWAEEFEKWWQSDDVAREEDDYMSAVEKFTERKVKELERSVGLARKYIVRRTCQKQYESTFLVEACDTDEAKRRCKKALDDDESIYEKMTERINCDLQFFEVMSVWDGKTKCDFDLTK